MRLTARNMTLIALFAALIATFSQISIPIGPIPINLALLAVFAAGGLLTIGQASGAVVLFLLLGAVGLPIFSGFNGGIGALAGPTGGYLIGYLPAACLSGIFARKNRTFWLYALGMIVGLAACYLLGTAWFVISTKASVGRAMSVCVLPFLPGDAIKIGLAAFLSISVSKAINAPKKFSQWR